ncbi:MAG: hypothetical protein PF541_14685 [Prolixibacteraceae bacterium]|nr:hypothetical protein [Prolixibacteraceae bacterium]
MQIVVVVVLFAFTFNLVNRSINSRALDHHKWYKQNFTAYPENRKAILPFVL